MAAGKQVTRFLEERGVRSTFVRGLRVTTDETIDAVIKVLPGSVNTQLVAALAVAGARAVRLTGVDAGIAWADQLDPELGYVGRVLSSDRRLLDTLTEAGYVPVGACLARGANGQVNNVNGDSMAVAVASNWKVDRLVFLTDVQGVPGAAKQRIPVLTMASCKALSAKEAGGTFLSSTVDIEAAGFEAENMTFEKAVPSAELRDSESGDGTS
jgi:acetylglutamate kinase